MMKDECVSFVNIFSTELPLSSPRYIVQRNTEGLFSMQSLTISVCLSLSLSLRGLEVLVVSAGVDFCPCE